MTFVAAIVSFNVFLDLVLSGGESFSLFNDIILTALVATPFTIFALALVQHLYKLQIRLSDLAGTDMLTGLANRRQFFEQAAREGELRPGTLILVDVDHFKRINDTYGHEVGDLCLLAVGRHLRATVREHDLVARIGGEEFAVYLDGANLGLAESIGRRVVAELPVETDLAAQIVLTASAGAAEAWPGATIAEVLRAADSALYRAKEQGRARLVFAVAESPVPAA
ncbi:GGDEF domain-containing protein [Pseudoroseicyclus sp. CXY001]|uniref:GGDEF domain-containing protein n=1 Tax=Pseudoroseicyclus sp. CXY001 TaxID=3242492 RepID=UPI003571372D